MAANDIFSAVDRYLTNKFVVEFAMGEVKSVSALTAQVIVNGSGGGQACSFNNDQVVQPGDSVFLIRSKWNKQWVINQVIGRPRAGNSVLSRPTPNNTPGTPHWASFNQQASQGLSWSGTSITQIASTRAYFTGGTPVLIYNGYVTPGASDVQMDIGWGEDADYQVIYRNTIKSTSPYTAVNIYDVLPGQLYGVHTFNIRAQLGAGGISPTLNCTRFLVAEM